jgi:hypothetical protein
MTSSPRILLVGLAVLVLANGCGGNSPIAPSSVTISRPLVLSGQSNALMVAPILGAIYPRPVLTVAESGRAIEGWSSGPTGVHWRELIPLLQQPIQAFAWWQGESDRDNANYLSDLRDLMARVRQTTANPQLLIIEVRILDIPLNAGVRAVQETFVRTDTNAVLISSDGFQLESGDHLTQAGYQAVAQRILDAARLSSVR